MIGRAYRFHGHNSLKFVYQHGQTVRGPLMSLRYSRNEKRQNYRLAVVVSKKVAKSAVDRNRIRRRLYEVIRLQPGIDCYDLVLTIFNADVARLPAKELDLKVADLLGRAHVIIKS
ncbi:MAG: ribonuclease P protein component [Candidatus Saccharimonadales bacterium]